MDLIHGIQTKHHYKVNTHFLIIRLPDSWVLLKSVARLVLLALFIVSFSWHGSILRGFSSSFATNISKADQPALNSINLELLPLLFRDLENEGLLKMGDRALTVSSGNDEAIYSSQILSNNEMDLISYSDSERQSSIPDETFDFAFMQNFHGAAEFIDRTLKIGGVAVVELSDDPLLAFRKPSNYKIVYLRRFDSTIIGLRKTSHANDVNSSTKRRLFGVSPEEKKAALKQLEDVLLEPPRSASGKSERYLKRTRYLPDLIGDSLESYPRRVFIDVGLPEKDDVTRGSEWFAKHYPTRNKNFEMYKIETVVEESSGKESTPIGMSDWLKRNVREEEYVVMKAEAEIVEEMEKNRVLGLVDELFLECKHQKFSGNIKKSRRAYWECLALYGRLRDEGVVVHQWWG